MARSSPAVEVKRTKRPNTWTARGWLCQFRRAFKCGLLFRCRRTACAVRDRSPPFLSGGHPATKLSPIVQLEVKSASHSPSALIAYFVTYFARSVAVRGVPV